MKHGARHSVAACSRPARGVRDPLLAHCPVALCTTTFTLSATSTPQHPVRSLLNLYVNLLLILNTNSLDSSQMWNIIVLFFLSHLKFKRLNQTPFKACTHLGKDSLTRWSEEVSGPTDIVSCHFELLIKGID